MNFGQALEAMVLQGLKIMRRGWNGKDMFLYYVGANEYESTTEVARRYFGADAKVPYQAYIAMKTAQGTVVPWTASQTDILSVDWEVVA